MKYIVLFFCLSAILQVGCSSTEQIVYPEGCDVSNTYTPTIRDSLKFVYGDKFKVEGGGIVGGMNQIYKHLEYPLEAKRQGISTLVEVTFILDRNGKVTEFKPDSRVSNMFNQAVSDALQLVKFTPMTIKGEAYCFPVALPVRFTLRD